MKVLQTLTALVLILAPGTLLAQGCHSERTQQSAMSCAEGQVWDDTAGTCVLRPSS
ncbi:MAG: hypothetical protein WAT25_12520 [Paracoccaceae bacterium]|jgi:hypothetical protein